VNFTAPDTAGAYHVKLGATKGTVTNDKKGLEDGSGIIIHYTVNQPSTSDCSPADTTLDLSVEPACIVVGTTTATKFTATLNEIDLTAISTEQVDFSVDDTPVDGVVQKTNSSGVATQNYDSSALTIGDHTVLASFQGEECLNASSDSKTLGVTYAFLGFQPPVQIDGNGVGLFSGKVIPVKIKIADANGNPITDAEPHVYFQQTNADVAEQMADSIANTAPDLGNTMRYDAESDQYILNWDVSKLIAGTYNIRIDLGEGSCGETHLATVTIKPPKGGKK
jgi:hypothetical protein